jgi:glutamyl/glutaminyl-tRNA synthetase
MFRSRIAPTPSGYLHLGNAANFVLIWLWTRHEKGELLLRIDDLDQDRVRPEYVSDIFHTLEWLGLDHDKGPGGPEELDRQWSQFHRMPLYIAALKEVAELPEVFGCTCSRKQIREMSLDGQYPGTCRDRNLSLNVPDVAWRILTPQSVKVKFADLWAGEFDLSLYDLIRDGVLRKKDGYPAYQLSSIVDDLHFGINGVIRGEDLLPSTAIQYYTAEKLGYADFARIKWMHHPLVEDEAGQKMSKSLGSQAIQTLRESGVGPERVYQLVSKMLGFESELASNLGELQAQFTSFRQGNL